MADEAGIGPSERQVNTLTFQQLCRFQIFDEKPETLNPRERSQLLAVSNKYGYSFVGTNSAVVKVIKTDELVRISDEMEDSPGSTVMDYPHQKLSLDDKPIHIAINCQDQVLSVVTRGDASLSVHIFDVVDVCKQASSVKAFLTTSLSKESDVDLLDLKWNPTTPSLFAACLSDGKAELWTWTEGRLLLTSSLPDSIKAEAICWSPKGKQIVIGTNEGKLMQFTHTMEQKKVVSKPDFANEAVKVVDILWLSTFMWIVAYIDEEETLQPNVVVVHAPKEQPTSFINFEDICFGSGEDRKAKYYMKFLEKWGFVIASSGNSMETGILGQRVDDKTSWDIWTLDDTARVELPLCDDDDTFPMGLSVDFSSERSFLAVNKQKLDPVPILLMLSSEGLLCPFHIINKESSESLQQKMEPLPAEGVSKGMVITTDGQPAGGGSQPQGSIELTATGATTADPKAQTKPVNNTTPFSFTTPSQPPSANQGGAFSFGGSSVFSAAGAQISQPTDDSSAPTGAAQTKPFTFSGPSSSTPTSSTQVKPFSFSGASLSATTGVTEAKPFSFSGPSSSAPTSTVQTKSFSFSGTPTSSTQTKPFSFSGASSSVPTGVAETKPFSFSGAPSTTTNSSTGQFSFSKPVSTSSQISGSVPSFVSTKPSATQGGLFGTVPQSSSGPFSAGGQGLFGAKAQTSQGQSAGSPFSFSKQSNAAGQPAASSQVSISSVAQAAIPASFSFPKTPGGSDKTAAIPQPVVSQTGVDPQVTSALKAPAKPQGTVTTNITPAGKTSTGAPPNQVAPMMKTLPFPVTEEPQGTSSQITLPKVQDVPKAPGNLSVTIPLEQRKGVMQAQRAASAAAEAQKQAYAPVVEPVSPVSSVSTATGGEHLESALMSNILDEMDHFQKEIRDLKSRTGDGSYSVGKEGELRQLRMDMDDLDAFKADVLECTKSLNEDVHSIKGKLLNSFALLEESKIRKQRNKDPKFITLLKARGLDPQTASKMQEVRGMYHYLDVGTRDVNRSLDMEWEESQRRGSRSRKLATPTMDTVYHTLRNHHNIMASQRIALEEIREKLVRAQKYDPIGALYKGPLPSPKFRSDDVEPLALKLSETRIHPARRESRTPASMKKQSLLRDILSRRTQTPLRSSPKVLFREEQVVSPTLSYSSEGSYTPQVGFSKKLDFTDEGRSEEPSRGTQETRFRRAITPQKESTPVKDVIQGVPSKQEVMPPRQVVMPPAYPKTSGAQQLGTGSSTAGRVPPTGIGFAPPKMEPSSSIAPSPAVSQAEVAVTTSAPSSFAHTGTGTVLWGADTSKATPSQLAGAAALSRVPAKGQGPLAEPVPSKLPPNVNIKNLDSLKSTMPPPVTFAAVASSVDTDTAQVVTQVLSEITATSGKSVPPPGTAVTDTPLLSSKSVEAPSITSMSTQPKLSTATSLPASKPSSVIAEAPKSGGTLHTPVAASTPFDSAAGTQQTKFDFSSRNNSASSTVPGAFFTGALDKPTTGTGAAFSLPKTEASVGAAQPQQATNATLRGLIMDMPTDSQPPTSIKDPATSKNADVPKGTGSGPAPPSAPISFSFSSGSSNLTFGGSQTGTIFNVKPQTAAKTETPSAFGQVVTTKFQSVTTTAPVSVSSSAPVSSASQVQTTPGVATAQSATTAAQRTTTVTQSAAAVTQGATTVTTNPPTPGSQSKSTSAAPFQAGETEAAGPFVFPVSKTTASSTIAAGIPNLFGSSVQSTAKPTNASIAAAAPISSTPSSTPSFFGNQATSKPQSGTGFSFSFGGVGEGKTSAAPIVTTSSSGFSFANSSSGTATTVVTTTVSPFSIAATSAAAQTATTTSSSGFPFTPSSQGSSVFGGSSLGGSLFGSSTATTKQSLFGTSSTTSGFGVTGASTTSSSGGFSFGQPTTTSQSLFGQSTSTTQSIFGQPSSFGSSASQSPFGQKSGFGQTAAPSSSSSTNLFGQAASSGTSSGPFGTATTSAEQGGGVSFGGLFGLGGKPNPEAAKTNPFGVQASPAAAASPFGGTNLFGGQGPKAFGSPTSSGGFGAGSGGSFSSGSAGVGTGGFGGISQTSTASSGFGGAPTFGGSPAFGSKPAFGSPSGFGSGAAFSNPLGQNTFGASPSSGAVFGSSSSMGNSNSAGFGGFASQNTPSFGGIASNSPPGFGTGGGGGFGTAQTSSAFGGSTGFGGFSSPQGSGFGNSSNSSFGTSSFSQYRN